MNEDTFQLMPYGKYKDRALISIYEEDEEYLRWVLGEMERKNSPFSKKLCFSINKIFNPNFCEIKKKIVLIDTSTPDCPF